jgi:hypothetical protein
MHNSRRYSEDKIAFVSNYNRATYAFMSVAANLVSDYMLHCRAIMNWLNEPLNLETQADSTIQMLLYRHNHNKLIVFRIL